MRPVALLPTLLCACMSPAEADELHYDDEDEPSTELRIVAIPDGAPEPEPSEITAPEPDVRSGGVPRYRFGGDGTVDNCIEVHALGFPAIDPSGSFVAASQEQWLQMTPFPGPATLRIIALGEDRADELTSIVPEDADTMEEENCRALRPQVRKAVRLANAELASRGFHSMAELAVEYGNIDAAPDVVLEKPARERPLQVIVQHGEAIVRIPGVKVYERHAFDTTPGDWLYAVHGDRATGTVVLTIANCMGDSCTCDPMFTAAVMHWDEATFAVLDARPCVDPEADDGKCSGVDYGF